MNNDFEIIVAMNALADIVELHDNIEFCQKLYDMFDPEKMTKFANYMIEKQKEDGVFQTAALEYFNSVLADFKTDKE